MKKLSVNGENIKIMKFFFKNHQLPVAMVLFFMFVSGALESLNLAALYPIINYGLRLKDTGIVSRFFDFFIKLFGQGNLFSSACILLIIITVLAAVTKIVFNYLSNKLIRDVSAENEMAVFQKLMDAEYNYFVKSQQGRLVYAGTLATQGVTNNVMEAIRLLNSLVTCLFFAVVMTLLAWQAMIFVAALGLLYVFFIRKILNGVVNKYARLSIEEYQKKNVILNEIITGIKTVKAFSNASFWQEKYADAVNKSVVYRFMVNMGRVMPDSFLKLVFFMVIAFAGIGLNHAFSGDIVVLLPALGTFVAVASRMIPYVNMLGADVVGMARYMPDCKIAYDILNEKIEKPSWGSRNLETFSKDIIFDRVSFKYEGMDEDLLREVNFTVEKRKMTAIVGPSGSGKSTIVSLLLGLYRPSAGRIKIDGISINEFTESSYLSKIGYVSQETFIFNGTIRDNICFGDKDATDAEVKEAAELANAHEFIMASEKGYQAIVGDAGMKLSGGQRQRLAIARAMLRKPEILILDEATSSLDNVSERTVQEAVDRIAGKTTIVVIAHRLSTVQDADKIIVLEHGKIVEEGTHDHLLGKKDVYYNLYTS